MPERTTSMGGSRMMFDEVKESYDRDEEGKGLSDASIPDADEGPLVMGGKRSSVQSVHMERN